VFSRERVVADGKAAFYACIYGDIRKAAMDCGWALGLHGSLASDMDIMAMPWTEDARPVEEMIQALSDCFTINFIFFLLNSFFYSMVLPIPIGSIRYQAADRYNIRLTIKI
jgi:hypothetical protein